MKRAWSLLVSALLGAGVLHADVPALDAHLSCERGAGPGRILCEVSSQARSGRLVWSDALVVRAPAFARPLRSRFVLQLGAASEPGVARAKLALVASEAGQGELELAARGVVCREGPAGEQCTPELVHVTAQVVVAPAASP